MLSTLNFSKGIFPVSRNSTLPILTSASSILFATAVVTAVRCSGLSMFKVHITIATTARTAAIIVHAIILRIFVIISMWGGL